MTTISQNETKLQRLENKECIQTYASNFLGNRGNLIMITDKGNPNATNAMNSSVLAVYRVGFDNIQQDVRSDILPYYWLCGSNTPCSSLLNNPERFSVQTWVANNISGDLQSGKDYSFDIQYCLSQQLVEHCSVEANLSILSIIAGLISLKVICMGWMTWRLKERPLAVLGDAIASFLELPDIYTRRNCLGAPKTFGKHSEWEASTVWRTKRRIWGAAASLGQWVVCVSL
jgi:hypothetical protein